MGPDKERNSDLHNNEIESRELNERRENLINEINRISDDISDAKTRKERKELRDKRDELKKELGEISGSTSYDHNSKVETTNENAERINELIGELESIRDEYTSRHKNLGEKAKEVDELLSELDKIREKYDELEDRSEKIDELEETAEGLLERTTSSALGEQFAERKSELESTLYYWKIASVATISLLVIFSSIIYYDIATTGATINTNVAKVALILPISVSVWFTVSNYSRQKKLMEEYEFKARMALSLPGFREVLKDEVPDNDHEVVSEFVTSSMERIYSNPQENISQDPDGENESSVLRSQRPPGSILRRFQ